MGAVYQARAGMLCFSDGRRAPAPLAGRATRISRLTGLALVQGKAGSEGDGMHSWLVWSVALLAAVLLGFVGYHFTVRVLRFFTAAFAVAAVVFTTRYGVTHRFVLSTRPGAKHLAPPPTDLVNAFTRGVDDLSAAFFRPLLLGHSVPSPGRIGWLVLAVGVVFGYRELEVWAMRWQPPALDMSALGGSQPAAPKNGAAGGSHGGRSDRQLHDRLVAELRFRLPAVDVRAPAILPGGATTAGLASIVENSGVEGGGLAGAILRFVGALWPNPRRYQVRVWLEPARGAESFAAGRRVTVDLEDPRTGGSIATKTLPVRDFDEASSVVAGYVARHIFMEDPTAPPWCVGSFDGSDLAALLVAGQQKAYPQWPYDVRDSLCRQVSILQNCNSLEAGVGRYELAHLYDLKGDHVKALLLHALDREHFPRFYRSRYRLGMSLEMIANPFFELADTDQEIFGEILRILDRCGLTCGAEAMYATADRCDAAGAHSPAVGNSSRDALRTELLTAAKKELSHCRRQLSLWHVVWGSFWHRDERVMRKPYWGLRERQSFHDGALVAELLVTVRQVLNNERCTRKAYRHARKAMRITAAITGGCAAVEALLTQSDPPAPSELKNERPPGQSAKRRRWVPWQHRTRSWAAAYNTACIYAALADSCRYDPKEMARRVVISLTRAITDDQCELERPSDWISRDPDFSCLKCSAGEFKNFLHAQTVKDYPAVSPEPGTSLVRALRARTG